MKSAYTEERESGAIVSELARGLAGEAPEVVLAFVPHTADGAAITRGLKERFPGASVAGCTHAGAYTEAASGPSGVSAIALSGTHVRRAASALARFEGGVREGMDAALDALEASYGAPLRTLDPKRYVGLLLVEGLEMHEEEVNEILGNRAPQLAFVGGSAGDALLFQKTHVFHEGEASGDGAVLLLLESARPFVISKTCSCEPAGQRLTVTRADAARRVVYEIDDEPAIERYAAAIGKRPDELGLDVFLQHPFGLMVDGQPWIRSTMQVTPDGGMRFACAIAEGMEVELMRSTDLIADLERALHDAKTSLASEAIGGVVFNCALRRLELDQRELHGAFRDAFAGMTIAGFHTYGESYLGHINQTFTALFWA